MQNYRLSYLTWVVTVSLCLVTLSVFTAVSLVSQQRSISRVLRENVQSQRSAIELEECLVDLIDLENDRVEDVKVLHSRVGSLLNEMKTLADQQEEAVLHNQLTRTFAEYLKRWEAMPPRSHPTHEQVRKMVTQYLESDVLKPCQEFEHYNSQRIEQSANHHERLLRQLAWGLGGVSFLGGSAGIVLGFGIARRVSRNIRRLKVSLRDAAGKLGETSPEIVLTEEGEFGQLHAEVDRLSERIEGTVRELQQREHEILRAEQLAAVGQLAAGMAHEIRNPLTSIKMLVQAGQESSAALTAEDLRIIEAEIRRMERSLKTFLEFARPPKLHRKTVPLNTILEDVTVLLRMRVEKQRVQLRLHVPEAVSVSADPEQLRQVFMNLSLNALDMMPSGGQLDILVRSAGTEWEIEIADSGPGIAETILPRLFEPFTSTKDTGLGLGLVTSKRIVEAHGGRMNAANRVGGGASFFVRLRKELLHGERPVD